MILAKIKDWLYNNWRLFASLFLIYWLLWYNITMRNNEAYCQTHYKYVFDFYNASMVNQGYNWVWINNTTVITTGFNIT